MSDIERRIALLVVMVVFFGTWILRTKRKVSCDTQMIVDAISVLSLIVLYK